MSAVWLVLIGVLLAVLEFRWSFYALKNLSYTVKFDRMLAEPGEEITLTGIVSNRGRLPVNFVRLQNDLPPEILVIGEKSSDTGRCQKGMYRMALEDRLSIGGRRAKEKTFVFAIPCRGSYQVGSYTLSAGDLLGFSERDRHEEGRQKIVVVPKRLTDERLRQAVGGFMGDISVRRFLLEDPVLTVGFHGYTGREPFRDISWKKTAVAGSLQVKEYDHTAEPMATVLLNVYGGQPEELEQCFRLARMACEMLERQKIPYAFYTNGSLIGPMGRVAFLPSGLGRQHLQMILYGLGCASYTCFYSFGTLAERVRRQRKGQENYLVITPPLDEEGRAVLQDLERRSDGPVCLLVGEAAEEETAEEETE